MQAYLTRRLLLFYPTVMAAPAATLSHHAGPAGGCGPAHPVSLEEIGEGPESVREGSTYIVRRRGVIEGGCAGRGIRVLTQRTSTMAFLAYFKPWRLK